MKIKGNGNHAKVIRITHKGANFNSRIFVLCSPFADNLDVEKPEEVEIVFDDLYEVENMIDVLSEYKQSCRERIGGWKNERIRESFGRD